jgi:polyisoprenoid-binding protein YceI
MKTLSRFLAPIALVLPLAAATGLPATEFTLDFDPAQAKVEITLPASLHTVHGTFRLKSGAVRFDPATGKASGLLVVDTASGLTGNSSRDEAMHKKVLESVRFPEITFAPDRAEGRLTPEGASDLKVHGMFKIHGVEHELVMPMHVQAAGEGLAADSTFEIPYVSWGMKNPSVLLLRVNDKVQVEIHATGHVHQ